MSDEPLPTDAEIDEALRADRRPLRDLRRRVQRARAAGKPHDRNLARLRRQLAASVELRARRRERRPAPRYPGDLPVTARREELLATIDAHPVVVVCGETGSGKSTQLPKMLLELGYGVDGMIGHTQPRRIAARSIAERIAEELGTPLGRDVGFQVRFGDTTGPETYIKLMTDGILLAETQRDRRLDRYDALIIDEAHERSLNIDFLLGYLRRLRVQRPDLKLVITSATIDPDRFAAHFADEGGPAPIVEVSGRTYPVEVRYRPPRPDEETGEIDPVASLLDAIDEVAAAGDGDVLVFLPTQRDILETAELLQGRRLPGARELTVLPLFARLSPADQQRVFKPTARRRVVLATNVAESSITVPGIRYVIDTGTARISRYSARSRLQRLPIEPISRASADQRKGRCGRLGPGVCVRLYDEQDYLGREAFTTPEIQRSHLAAVVLRMAALRLGHVEDFPFIDPPRGAMVRDGYKTLHEIGALDDRERLTPIGRRLATLPVDPRIGRMILAAHEEGCLADVLVIAAALETHDARDRPVGQEDAADRAHARWNDPRSDFLGFLALWDGYRAMRAGLSRRALARACREAFLSVNRLREWSDVHRQLRDFCAEAGMDAGKRPAETDVDAVHRAVLAGLLGNIARREGRFDYTGAGGKTLHLWPGSALFTSPPPWIVSAEVVETRRRFARLAAPIDPLAAERLAAHLVKRKYGSPRWDRASGQVVADERVTLFGLVLVPKRRVPYAPVDPAGAREVFIRRALVEGKFDTRFEFLAHNREVRAEAARLEAKLRRRGVAPDDDACFLFYDRRVPADVVGAHHFNGWFKRARREDADLLRMTLADVVSEARRLGVDESSHPDAIAVQEQELPLRYRHEPGATDDGITVSVPAEGLAWLDADRLDWLVPGLLHEKVVALIRSLPKPLRRRLVPVPETAARVVDELPFGRGSLRGAIAQELGRLAGTRVDPADFDDAKVEAYLRMNVEVLDTHGEPLARGRDVAALRAELDGRERDVVEELRDEVWHADRVESWTFGEVPERLALRRAGLRVEAFPAVVDHGDAVALRLRRSAARARRETVAGVRRLFVLAIERELRKVVRRWPDIDAMTLAHATLGTGAELEQAAVERAVDLVFADVYDRVRDPVAFDDLLARDRHRTADALERTRARFSLVLSAYGPALAAVEEAAAGVHADAAREVRRQLDALAEPGFLVTTPWAWLAELPRYFAALARRVEKFGQRGAEKDRELAARVERHERAWQGLAARLDADRLVDPEVVRFRWMLEEFRVSVFAQELGTRVKVSDKRLDEQWGRATAAAWGAEPSPAAG